MQKPGKVYSNCGNGKRTCECFSFSAIASVAVDETCVDETCVDETCASKPTCGGGDENLSREAGTATIGWCRERIGAVPDVVGPEIACRQWVRQVDRASRSNGTRSGDVSRNWAICHLTTSCGGLAIPRLVIPAVHGGRRGIDVARCAAQTLKRRCIYLVMRRKGFRL
jgi:hypothetical protein